MRVASLTRWLSLFQACGPGMTPAIGIDLSPAEVRLVELTHTTSEPRIAHHARASIAEGGWQSARNGDAAALVDAIRRALKASGTRLRAVALALPAAAVITRTLCLPQGAHEDDIESLVEADAVQSLPFPREEISLDFTILGPSAGDEGMVDVLMVAARTERIAQHLSWVEAAGLRPQLVTVDTHAVMAAVAGVRGIRGIKGTKGTKVIEGRSDELHPPHPPESILHVSAEGVHCLFMRDGRLLFERELGVPLTIPHEAWLDAACLAWQRHAQLFAASATSIEIDHLYLTGAGAIGPALAAGLQARLGIGVSCPDPFLHWSSMMPLIATMGTAIDDSGIAGGSPEGGDYLLACGLALRILP